MLFQLIVSLAVIINHALGEGFDVGTLGVLLRQMTQLDFCHSALRRLVHEVPIGSWHTAICGRPGVLVVRGLLWASAIPANRSDATTLSRPFLAIFAALSFVDPGSKPMEVQDEPAKPMLNSWSFGAVVAYEHWPSRTRIVESRRNAELRLVVATQRSTSPPSMLVKQIRTVGCSP